MAKRSSLIPKPSRVLFLLVCLAFSASLLGGCAAMRASSARNSYIRQQTSEHVYTVPFNQVWPAARQILFEKAYQVRDSETGDVPTLETEWNIEGDYRVRYLVQGIKISPSQTKVHFTRNQQRLRQQNASITSSRDLNMEWNLLRRVDAGSALQIQAEADARASAARAAN